VRRERVANDVILEPMSSFSQSGTEIYSYTRSVQAKRQGNGPKSH
jgi:hypothetical protein